MRAHFHPRAEYGGPLHPHILQIMYRLVAQGPFDWPQCFQEVSVFHVPDSGQILTVCVLKTNKQTKKSGQE